MWTDPLSTVEVMDNLSVAYNLLPGTPQHWLEYFRSNPLLATRPRLLVSRDFWP